MLLCVLHWTIMRVKGIDNRQCLEPCLPQSECSVHVSRHLQHYHHHQVITFISPSSSLTFFLLSFTPTPALPFANTYFLFFRCIKSCPTSRPSHVPPLSVWNTLATPGLQPSTGIPTHPDLDNSFISCFWSHFLQKTFSYLLISSVGSLPSCPRTFWPFPVCFPPAV